VKRPIAAFSAYCLDAPAAEQLRREHLAAHLAHVETVMDRLLLAGPLKQPDGAVLGSLIVIRAETEAEARALLESDPYHRAGIWQTIRIERFVPVAGTLVGGRNW
jgi:uncharacterized protein YciI